jgi:hypothetical protein
MVIIPIGSSLGICVIIFLLVMVIIFVLVAIGVGFLALALVLDLLLLIWFDIFIGIVPFFSFFFARSFSVSFSFGSNEPATTASDISINISLRNPSSSCDLEVSRWCATNNRGNNRIRKAGKQEKENNQDRRL